MSSQALRIVLSVILAAEFLFIGFESRSIENETDSEISKFIIRLTIYSSLSYSILLILSVYCLKYILDANCFRSPPWKRHLVVFAFGFSIVFYVFLWCLSFMWPLQIFLHIGSYFLVDAIKTALVMGWFLIRSKKTENLIRVENDKANKKENDESNDALVEQAGPVLEEVD